MKFLDEAKVYIRSGNGGNGCVSFRREKYIEFGGPDGGNGGKGGDIIIRCVDGLNTLIDFRYQQHFKAAHGQHGKGKNRHGAKGAECVLRVPVGTQILDEEKKGVLTDLTRVGQSVTLCHGGKGGYGNAHYKSATNQTPRFARDGKRGEEQWIWLRLKLIAHVGIIGMPNAGKSTFLSRVSRAKPKIADYPFTTLYPHLGVVHNEAHSFVMADIPGLIAGAHQGHGLGTRFLGHVERCSLLLHLVDATHQDVIKAYETTQTELRAYGNTLDQKSQIIALGKADALSEESLKKKKTLLESVTDAPVHAISSLSGFGCRPLLAALHHRLLKAESDAVSVHARDEQPHPVNQ